MTVIYVLQVLVPLLLILWIGIFTARNLFSFVCESLAVFTLLLTLVFTGMWIIPPWWTPYVFALLLLAVILHIIWRKPRFDSVLPAGVKNWIRPSIFIALIIISLTQLLPALRGRVPPQQVVALEFPLESGDYLIISGGDHGTINSHFMTLDENVPRFRQWRGQSYALDIVKVNNWAFRGSGIMPANPTSYFIYGTEVLAPCTGSVKKVVDNVPDNQVPIMNRESMSGNHVILSCEGVEVVLAHLIPNSIRVSENSRVVAGQFLGLAGNSGNSGEPHLHIHVQAVGAPEGTLDTNPIPFTIAGQYWVRNQIMLVP